jgi:hypothetical protein
MKKVLLGIVVLLLLLVGGGLYLVYTNLDLIVERGIETAGTEAAGTPVRVDAVDLDLLAGSATIRGFTLANPPGYSDAAMLSFAELAVVIDTASLNRNGIHIVSVTARNPHLLYESHDGTANLDVMRERMASDEPAPDAAASDFNIVIDSILIEGISATVSSDLMPQPADVDLGDIRLQDLSGTPDEVAQQVLRPLLTQLAANAGRVALTLLPEDVRAAGAAVRDAAAARLDQAREGLGNLLRRGDDEADTEEEDADTNVPADQ